MKVLQVCVLLAVTIGLGSCYSNYTEKSFRGGIYITWRNWSSIKKIRLYRNGFNDLGIKVRRGLIVVQFEQKCPPNSTQQIIYSFALMDINPLRPPFPKDKALKLDFQLNTPAILYGRKLKRSEYFEDTKKLNRVAEEFAAQLELDGKFAETKWYYISDTKGGEAEIWLQKMTGHGRKSCPPDDANIQQLCDPNFSAAYSCPNTTYSEKNGVETRNMDMYIVTGKAQTYEEHNCSFNYAVNDQQQKNHDYFMGHNIRHMIMKRTVPVMFKTTLVYNPTSRCGQKYQTQFFVSSKALGGVVPPCPTDPAVMLQKINMEVYVKTYNGNVNGDMVQLKNLFMQELTSKGLPYLSNQHYVIFFRNQGPILGHRMEIWILKTQPTITIVC